MAISDVLNALQSGPADLGAAAQSSASTGLGFAGSFRAQDQALVNNGNLALKQNAQAFETALRAGKAYGENQQRQLENEQNAIAIQNQSDQIRINREQARLRGIELNSRNEQFERTFQQRDDHFAATHNQERHEYARGQYNDMRQRHAMEQAMGVGGNVDGLEDTDYYSNPPDAPPAYETNNNGAIRTDFDIDLGSEFGTLDDDGIPTNELQDWSSFAGGSGGYEITNYGYASDHTSDTNSNKLRKGNRNNRLIPGVSIALDKNTADRIGSSPGDVIAIEHDNGVQYGIHHDTVPSSSVTGEGTADLFTPNSGRNDFRGRARNIRVAAKGEAGNGFAGQGIQGIKNWMAFTRGRSGGEGTPAEATPQGNGGLPAGNAAAGIPGVPDGNAAAPTLGGETDVDSGPGPVDDNPTPQPSDKYLDADYIRSIPEDQRIPFRQAAKGEERAVSMLESELKAQREILEIREEDIQSQVADSEQINMARFGKRFASPDLIAKEREIRQERIQLAREDAKVRKERSRVDAKLAATAPEFKFLTDTATKEVATTIRVKSQLDRVRDEWANLDKEEQGRIQGRYATALNKVRENTDLSTFRSSIIALLPTLARGVFGEVGVLTEGDIARYMETLPTAADSAELGERLIGTLEEILDERADSLVTSAKLRRSDAATLIDSFKVEGFDIKPLRKQTPKELEAQAAKEADTKKAKARERLKDGKPHRMANGDVVRWNPATQRLELVQ